jgi:glycosyltransferase involved in cell wall biosynthesis
VSLLHVVVPDGIDDPARPSGGNTYDRRVCQALAAGGWSIEMHAVRGCWPLPDASAYAELASVIDRIGDQTSVLIDGLVASTAAEVLVPQAGRVRLIALVHMPLGIGSLDREVRRREKAVLSAAAAVIATSRWSRRRLLQLYALPAQQVHVAEPGVDPAQLAPGTPAGQALLCVAPVIPAKGHDLLLDALMTTADMSWECVCAGSLDRDSAFSEGIRRQAVAAGLGDRVRFLGPQVGGDLDRVYAAADLLVLPSRAETYGMVVTEALARGLPVIAAEVGGVPEALGHAPDRTPPGLLVPAGDARALGAALRAWLSDPELRTRLRLAARRRRESLPGWSDTAAAIAGVVGEPPA